MWPHERSLVLNLKDKPFALIGVNIIGQGPAYLKKTMDKEKLTWRSFADRGPISQGEIATRWNLSATPTFYIIDHRGVIRHKWVGRPSEKAVDAALEKWIQVAELDGKE